MSDENQTFDKVDLHNRQQLSALMDGALAPDEARFLLRRLCHDGELADCWERWQLAGEVMRGRTIAVLPPAFAARVGVAIAAEAMDPAKTAAQPRVRWLRWGGSVALAASVAVVTLLATRLAPDVDPPPQAPMMAAATAPAVQSRAPLASSPAAVAANQATVASTAASVAVADAPRRATQRGRALQRQRVAARAPSMVAEAAPAESAIASAVAPAQSPRPFDAGAIPSARPWPRAVLPQFGASGALTAGTDASTSPSFYPFEPRLPEDAAEPDAAPVRPR